MQFYCAILIRYCVIAIYVVLLHARARESGRGFNQALAATDKCVDLVRVTVLVPTKIFQGHLTDRCISP